MNYIEQITATGMTSGDFTHQLGRLTIFTGKSCSGKTSAINTVRLGLRPELRDPTRDVLIKPLDLARNGHLSVVITDNQGRKTSREWGGKSVITSEEIPPCPAVALDSNEYFKLSDAKKIEYAFGLMRMEESEEFSGPGIVAALKNIKVENNTAETEAIVSEIIRMVDASESIRRDCRQPIQQWIAEELTHLRERLKVAKATCDRMSKTVAGITQIGSAEIPARDYKALLDEKRQQLTELAQVIGGLEQSLRDYELLKSRADGMAMQLTQTPITEVPDVTAKVAELESDIKVLTEDLSTDHDFSKAIEDRRQTIEKLQAEVAAYKSKTPELHVIHSERVLTVKTLAREIEGLKLESDTALNDYAAWLTRPCCPECGTPQDGFRAPMKARLDEKLLALSEKIKSLSEKLEDAKALASDTESTWLAAARRADAEIEDVRDNIQRLIGLQSKNMEAMQRAASERNGQIESRRKAIADLQARVKAIQESNKTHDDIARRQLNDARMILAEIPYEAKKIAVQTAYRDRAEHRGAIETLEEQQRTYQRQQDDEQRNSRALQEHARAKADVEVTKAAIETLEDIRTKMVETAFAGILETVNRITGSIIPEPIEYREGEIGRWKGSKWIRQQLFSETERALIYAGISLALGKDAPIRIVIMDELGRMDKEETIGKFLATMARLIEEGFIDQFVGAFPGTLKSEIPGVTIIPV